MTKMMHHRMVAMVGVGTLITALAVQPPTVWAQPGVAASMPSPMPVPTPIAPPAVDPGPGPATVVAPPAEVPPASTFTTPEISAPSMIAPTTAAMQPSPTTVDDGEHGPKSPSAATGYALLGVLSGPVFMGLAAAAADNNGDNGVTTGLALLSVFGFIAGPSAGRWYVGELGGGPLLARGLGAGLMLGGAVATICWENCGDTSSAETAIIAGLGIYVVATLYDVATAGDVAREYNRNHRRSTGPNLTFAPMVKRSEGTAATTTGLMLGGSF